jgi:uncharacterized membrane protein
MWFIVFHIVWFAVWLAWNINPHGKHTFDPYPFALMTMIVSLESIFLSLFILMSQNRTGLQADQRNHLELQINLLCAQHAAHAKRTTPLPAKCGPVAARVRRKRYAIWRRGIARTTNSRPT